ncbi:unnamed protein product [Closterium sp. NIES-54]
MYQLDYFDDGTGRVCKLLKSLYGLKKEPLLWYRALDGVLLGVGWKKSQVDEALYFKASDNRVTCWVLVYVNDLLAASSSPAMLKELKQLLEDAFELREISPVVKYLGLEIVRDRPARKLWLHQQSYADKLRRSFIDEEQGGRVPKTPVSVDAYTKLTFDDEEAQEHGEEEYREKVGLLQFAATTTRPDIAFAGSKLGIGLTVRSDQHWHEVDCCLAYLADNRDTALEFSGGPESLELIGYVDAEDAGDKQNRMSTSGYVFVYGGAAVSWSSSLIKCATLSSTESEYVAATNAGKEGRRLRFLLAEFKLLDAGKPTILRVDNKSAITVAAGLGLTGNLKHMERRYAWLQHMVRRRKFVLKYIPTTKEPADFLTKVLHFSAFNRCSVAIGQVRLAEVGDGDDDGARQLHLTGLGDHSTARSTTCRPPSTTREPLTREFADLLFLSYADDTYILGPAARLLEAFGLLREGMEGVGLEVQAPKCRFWVWEAFDSVQEMPLGMQRVEEGLTVVGIPIGAEDWEVARLWEQLRQLQTPLPWLPLLDHPQMASHLLAIAFSAQPMYLARTVPPRPEVVDSSLEDCFEQLFPSGTWEFDPARSRLARLQLHLPVRLGDFGIRAVTSLSPLSYACGWAQAARDIAQLGVAGEEAMFADYVRSVAGVDFLDPWFSKSLEQLPEALAVEELQAMRRLARDDATLAHFTSLQGPGAGAWVSAVPAHADFTFTAAEWSIAAAVRLGLPIQQRCVCGTMYADPVDPHHALRCKY